MTFFCQWQHVSIHSSDIASSPDPLTDWSRINRVSMPSTTASFSEASSSHLAAATIHRADDDDEEEDVMIIFFCLIWNVLGVQSLQTLKNPRCAVTSWSNYFFLSEFFSRDFKNKLSCDFSFHFRSFLLWMTWIRRPSSRSRLSNKVNDTLLSQNPPALLFLTLIFAYGNIRFFCSA